MKVYRLPPTFYWDHVARDLPEEGVSTLVRQTKQHVFVAMDDKALADLSSDAAYYSDTGIAANMQLPGLAASARATLKALAIQHDDLQNTAPDATVQPTSAIKAGNDREETVMTPEANTTQEAPTTEATPDEFSDDLAAAAKAADLKSQGKRTAKPDPKPGAAKAADKPKADKPKAEPKPKAEKPQPTVEELDAKIASAQADRDKHTKAFNAYRKADAALRVAKAKGESTEASDKAKDKARKGHNSYMRAYTQGKVALKQCTELYGAPKA